MENACRAVERILSIFPDADHSLVSEIVNTVVELGCTRYGIILQEALKLYLDQDKDSDIQQSQVVTKICFSGASSICSHSSCDTIERNSSSNNYKRSSSPSTTSYRGSPVTSTSYRSPSPSTTSYRRSPGTSTNYSRSPSPSTSYRGSPIPSANYRRSPSPASYRRSPAPLNNYIASPSLSSSYRGSPTPSTSYTSSTCHRRSASPSGCYRISPSSSACYRRSTSPPTSYMAHPISSTSYVTQLTPLTSYIPLPSSSTSYIQSPLPSSSYVPLPAPLVSCIQPPSPSTSYITHPAPSVSYIQSLSPSSSYIPPLGSLTSYIHPPSPSTIYIPPPGALTNYIQPLSPSSSYKQSPPHSTNYTTHPVLSTNYTIHPHITFPEYDLTMNVSAAAITSYMVSDKVEPSVSIKRKRKIVSQVKSKKRKVGQVQHTDVINLQTAMCTFDDVNDETTNGNDILSLLQPTVIDDISQEPVFKKQTEMSLKNIYKLEGIVSCPKCPYFVKLDDDMEIFICENSNCQVVCCRYCKAPWKECAEEEHAGCCLLLFAGSQCYTDISVLPANWNTENVEPSFIFKGVNYTSVKVPLMSKEGLTVSNWFHKTSKHVVVEVKRIQNWKRWESYVLKRRHMVDEIGVDNVNEKFLFHGTHSSTIDKICSEGFDFRKKVVNGSFYGRGNYFSIRAAYSEKYSNLRSLFLVSVLCGRPAQGTSEITHPPYDNEGRMHDSCVDFLPDPSMYIVYCNEQCYPAYVITYSSCNVFGKKKSSSNNTLQFGTTNNRKEHKGKKESVAVNC